MQLITKLVTKLPNYRLSLFLLMFVISFYHIVPRIQKSIFRDITINSQLKSSIFKKGMEVTQKKSNAENWRIEEIKSERSLNAVFLPAEYFFGHHFQMQMCYLKLYRPLRYPVHFLFPESFEACFQFTYVKICKISLPKVFALRKCSFSIQKCSIHHFLKYKEKIVIIQIFTKTLSFNCYAELIWNNQQMNDWTKFKDYTTVFIKV